MPGDGCENVAPKEIRFYVRQGGIKGITTYNRAFMLLRFVLLFPRGELGWERGIPLALPVAAANANEAEEQPQGRPQCTSCLWTC